MTARICIKLHRHRRRRFERLAKKTRDAALRTRIQIVLLYGRGWGCDRVAEALGCAPKHAVTVARRFEEEGEDAFIDRRCGNGVAKVDEDLLVVLNDLVDQQPTDFGWNRSTWSRELLAKELRRQTGVRVSVRTLGRMLNTLGARHGMARPLPRLEWSRARKTRRVKRILAEVSNLPKGEIAFYQDEVDIHLNPKIGRDWMHAGTQKGVLTPGKNQKRYLFGALAFDGSDVVYKTFARKNSDGFVAFLEHLRSCYPNAKKIHLILDNYVIHKSKKTQRYLAKAGVFVLHFLPPYSPEHNKIERLWRDLHGSVTRNHRCATIGELMQRVRSWLSGRARKRRTGAGRRSVAARRRAA